MSEQYKYNGQLVTSKHKRGDQAVVLMSSGTAPDVMASQNITVIDVISDLDNDNSYRVIITGQYSDLPDMLCLEYLGRIRRDDGGREPRWKIIDATED